MEPAFLDPLVILNRGLRFEHGRDELQEACDLIGRPEATDGVSLAREVVVRVHERLRVLPSALGIGAPKALCDIVRRRGGNCVSHTVLAVAVLRSHGLPARLVSEDVYTAFSLVRAPGALLRASIGPTLNGHVWLEVFADGRWLPADAELGVFGPDEWLRARVVIGVTVVALGVRISERWKFPLRLRRLDGAGQPCDDVTELYLTDELARRVEGGDLPAAWTDGVRHFARDFRWDGRPGLRLLHERRRLRGMEAALAGVVRRRYPGREG